MTIFADDMKTDEIRTLVTSILDNLGLFLVDLKINKDNRIELYVDSLQGVDIQTCAKISREIEAQLDRNSEDFELTVSSAGIGYPFKVEGQYQKNLNKTVEVKLQDHSRLTGLLTAFDSESITLEYEEKKAVEGKKKKEPESIVKVIPRMEIREIKDIVRF